MIKRRKPIKRGKIPKRTSKKRDADIEKHRAVVELVLARDRGGCQARGQGGCVGPLDVHEVLPRGRGGDWLDPDNCITVCRAHHGWIHDHPKEAKRKGWLR